ncbi:MAG: copper-binding protein (NosD) [Candidatus Nitrotoga sp. SPKER]|nr:MAG: copper-binding protein (NosD) [Candidatus Nitrotoga sp. SPKER]
MSGDYSRVRFDPRIDLSGVLMQQGRVQLDSDWNEWVAVLDRRLRAESVDTLGVQVTPGITGVAVVSPQTPDAFKIEASGGNITIGRGRMYVDGLLAENHGGGAAEFDAVLAELRGKTALAYNLQPYFPAPPALPGGGPHLAYLEVWQREITYLQQANLVESAVGVDTTTRLQTVWQVRLLANVSGASCTTPDTTVAGWQALSLPSGGRMSIKTEGVPPDLDPCELPPGGGYRGLENQLYRVEIHDGGIVGAAKFKWSRDNASVASNVVEVVSHTATSTELKLASLGRDAVLRFNTGDWVEILDDRRELSGENGDPALRHGVMRKISVDDAKQTISFSPALPANLIPGGGLDTLNSRHTRVRRWDQKGTVRDANNNVIVNLDAAGSTGLIPVPAAGVWVMLENGIQIQFSLDSTGGGFHCGDYWVSAARTNDTSVETYTQAPPRGIHRHYARLSIVTFPDDETDCRVKWPPECGGCCTINVAPGENIQTAIDSLPDEGGCVCLKTGVHNISATIQILSSRIILRGESPGSIVRAAGLARTLQIGDSGSPVSDIIVEGIRFEVTAAATVLGVLLYLESCTRVRVEHCALAVVLSPLQAPPSYVGINLNNVTDVDLIANRLDNFLIGILSQDYQGGLHITDNAIAGLTGRFLGQIDGSIGQYGIRIDTNHTQACRIENNRIRHFWVGISLLHNAAGSHISGNRISRSAGITQDNLPSDVAQMRSYLDSRLYAIDIEASRCEVSGNQIDLLSAAWGGIRVSGDHAIIAANRLEAIAKVIQLAVPVGIYCFADAKNGFSADHVVVSDNQLQGVQSGIIVSRIACPVIVGNHVDGAGAGWYGVRVDDCSDSRVDGNDLREVFFAVHLSEGERNRIVGNRIDQAGAGITATQQTNLEISDNFLQSCLLLGMVMFVRGTTALLKNRVLNCGYTPNFAIGIGVYAEEVLTPSGAHLRIEDCEVLDTGISADGSQVTTGNAIGIGGWMPACQISGNRIGYTQPVMLEPLNEHRALLLIGPLAVRFIGGAGEFAYMFGSAQVSDNHFSGPGRTHLVEFMRIVINDNIDLRFEKVTFSNNICDHLNAEVNPRGASVLLWGGHLIAMGNHIKAATNVNAMSLTNRPKIVLMGNITTGDYINTGTVTPLPIINFNVKI